MPSGIAEKEDKAKLDAAMAIAALSNELWDTGEDRQANPYSRPTAARNKRGGHRKSLAKINNSNGSLVTAPVMPARANNSAKRKRTGDVSNDLSEIDNPKSQTSAGDPLLEGKVVRSAKQTVANSLAGGDGSWYRLPSPDGSWYKLPESPVNLQSASCSPALTITNTVAVTDGEVPSEAKQTNGFLMTSLSPLFLPGSGLQLVPVFSQSGGIGLSPQLIADPHLLQLLCQQGNFLAVSIPNSPNPSPAVIEELDNSLSDDVAAKAAGTTSPAPAQLPGSLSTLRNYYNMTNASEPLSSGQPAAKVDVLSPSKVNIMSQPTRTVSNSYQITDNQFVNMRLASADVASLGGQGMLRMARGQRTNLSAGDDSASTFSSGTTSASSGTDSSFVSMPGSLNILRSYYSSLNPKTKQNASVTPSADHRADHIRTSDCQLSRDTLESALNLSKHRGERNEIQGTPGITATDAVRPCLLPEEESTGMAVNLKKMLNNGNNGQIPLSSCVLGSASTSSSSPLRILPKIGEPRSSNAASPASSHISDDQKRPDSVVSSISSVHLPPKKRRKVLSPEPIETPLNECCVVVGDEKVPLGIFMSRLDSRMHQIVINQIQSAIINQQVLAATSAEVSSKLPVIDSRLNLSSSSSTGLASVPNLNVNVNSKEMGNCMMFSIPSSVASPNIHLVDVEVTHGKRNAQVPAKTGMY